MRKANFLLGAVGWGFVLNGSVNTFFRDWLQGVTHFPTYEVIFLPVLEMVVGFVILGQWWFPSILRRLSRTGGLVYAWIGLGSALFLPSSKAFQYFSVKGMTLLYLCFYLFCILVLMNQNVKTLFLSKKELLKRSSPLEKIELDEATVRKISFWVNLIAIALIIDSFALFFLSFLWAKGSFPYDGLSRLLVEGFTGFALLGRSLGARKWASVICLLESLGHLIFTPLICVFLLPQMQKEEPELAFQVTSRPWLLPLGLIYGIVFFSIFVFLNRQNTKRYFEMVKNREIV